MTSDHSESDEDEFLGKQLKIVLLGDQNVGKTSLIRRFCFDEFSRQYNQTVGAEFYMKRLELSKDKEVCLRFFDIGGSEFDGHMLKNYLFNSNIILLVYDITNSSSSDNLISWLDSMKRIISNPVTVAVCGNKIDMKLKRSLKLDKALHFMSDIELIHFSLSAKTGENVNKCITNLVAIHLGVNVIKRANDDKRAEIPKTRAMKNSDRPNKVPVVAASSSSSVCSMQ